jgi:hypothetical protein
MAQTTRTYTLEEKAYFAAQYLVQHKLVTSKETTYRELCSTSNKRIIKDKIVIEFKASHFDNPGNLGQLTFTLTRPEEIAKNLYAQENNALLEELYNKITTQDSAGLKEHNKKSTEVIDNTSSDKSNAKLTLQKYREQANELVALTKQGGYLTDFLEAAYFLFSTLQKKEKAGDARENIAYLLAHHISDNAEIQRQYVELFKSIDDLVISVNAPKQDAKNIKRLVDAVKEHICHYPALLLRFADQAPSKTIRDIREEAMLPFDKQIAALKKEIGIDDETLGILKTIDQLQEKAKAKAIINDINYVIGSKSLLLKQLMKRHSGDTAVITPADGQAHHRVLYALGDSETQHLFSKAKELQKKLNNNPDLNGRLKAKKPLIQQWLTLEKQRDNILQTHGDDALASCVTTDNSYGEVAAQSLETLEFYNAINGNQQYFLNQGEHTEQTVKLFQQKVEHHLLLPPTRAGQKLFKAFRKEKQCTAKEPHKKWTRDLITLWEDSYCHLSKYNYSEEGIGAHLGTQEIIHTFCNYFDDEKETPKKDQAQCLKSYKVFFHDFLETLENTTKSSDKEGETSVKDLSIFDGKTLGRCYLFHTKLKHDLSKKPQQADEIIRKRISATTNYYASRNQLNKIDIPALSRLAQHLKTQLPKQKEVTFINLTNVQNKHDKQSSTDSEKTHIRGYSPVDSAGSGETDDLNTPLDADPRKERSISSKPKMSDAQLITRQLHTLEQTLLDFYTKNDSKNTNLPQVTAFVSNALNTLNLTDKIDQLYHAGNIIKTRLDNTKLFSFSGATTRGFTLFCCLKTQRQEVYEALKPLADLKCNMSQRDLLNTLNKVNADLDKALGKNSKKTATQPSGKERTDSAWSTRSISTMFQQSAEDKTFKFLTEYKKLAKEAFTKKI